MRMQSTRRRKVKRMGVLAQPKQTAYVVTRETMEKMERESRKKGAQKWEQIRENAKRFAESNLSQSKDK